MRRCGIIPHPVAGAVKIFPASPGGPVRNLAGEWPLCCCFFLPGVDQENHRRFIVGTRRPKTRGTSKVPACKIGHGDFGKQNLRATPPLRRELKEPCCPGELVEGAGNCCDMTAGNRINFHVHLSGIWAKRHPGAVFKQSPPRPDHRPRPTSRTRPPMDECMAEWRGKTGPK